MFSSLQFNQLILMQWKMITVNKCIVSITINLCVPSCDTSRMPSIRYRRHVVYQIRFRGQDLGKGLYDMNSSFTCLVINRRVAYYRHFWAKNASWVLKWDKTEYINNQIEGVNTKLNMHSRECIPFQMFWSINHNWATL